MPAPRRLLADHVVTPTGVRSNAVVEITDGRIVAVTDSEPTGGGVLEQHAAGGVLEQHAGWLVPGFVDTHVHGGGGADYATLDPAEALAAAAFHARHGTTTTFASLVTAPIDELCRQLQLLSGLTAEGALAGVHLEGPFLSPRQAGAHDPALLRHPEPALVDRLIEAADGALRMITLAPELPGALAAIERFRRAGVHVAVGHTDADLDSVEAAVAAGADVATHLFNAMRGVHHRRPGPIPLLLTDERVSVELIADGFHLHPQVLRLAVRAAGPDRVVLVTDAMIAAGMPDGRFRLGGLEVAVQDGMARLVDEQGGLGSIAGSTLTMAAAFSRMTGLLGNIAEVSALASANPARRFALAEVGRIEPGARADLCLVDEAGVLQRVMHGGRWLTDPA